MTYGAMGKTSWLTFLLLLAVAFAIGLTATVAASQVLVAPLLQQGAGRPTLERPAQVTPATPSQTAPLPTVEC